MAELQTTHRDLVVAAAPLMTRPSVGVSKTEDCATTSVAHHTGVPHGDLSSAAFSCAAPQAICGRHHTEQHRGVSSDTYRVYLTSRTWPIGSGIDTIDNRIPVVTEDMANFGLRLNMGNTHA